MNNLCQKTLLGSFLLWPSIHSYASPHLVGGKVAAPGEFTSVIVLDSGCTGIKIHPRFLLTAAHCITLDSQGLPQPSSHMGITFPQSQAPETTREVKLKGIHIHRTWSEVCSKMSCSGREVLRGLEDSTILTKPDVALIELAQDSLPEVSSTALGKNPVTKKDKLILTGYGCTKGIYSGESPENLQYQKTQMVSASSLNHTGSLYKDFVKQTALSYFITPGKTLAPSSASLCPGDSGGPVLRVLKDGSYEVVGINADYTFEGDYEAYGSVSRTNLHTRLDDESIHSVRTWILSFM